MARESRNWPSLVCPVCQKEFRPFKHNHRRRCCSERCRRLYDARRLLPEKKVMSPTEAAYLAAMLDGEGTISLWRMRLPANRRGWTLKPAVEVANTNVPLLESIRETAGTGFVARSTGTSHGVRRKPPYQWRLYVTQARWVLPQVFPYLRLKRRQAEIVLRYFEIVDVSRRTTEFTDELDALCRECQGLNRRGPVETTP